MIESLGWLITGKLAGSRGLIHHEELVWLRERRIGAIVSLTERSLRREKLLLHRLDSLGFACRCIPVIDGTAPSQAQVDELVSFEVTAGAGTGCARALPGWLWPDRDDAGLLRGQQGMEGESGDG